MTVPPKHCTAQPTTSRSTGCPATSARTAGPVASMAHSQVSGFMTPAGGFAGSSMPSASAIPSIWPTATQGAPRAPRGSPA